MFADQFCINSFFDEHERELDQWSRLLAAGGVRNLALVGLPGGMDLLRLSVDILRCAKLERLYLGCWHFPGTADLPDGTGVILGRDARENKILRDALAPTDTLLAPVTVPGPTALLPRVHSPADLALARQLVCAWSRFDQFPGDITVRTTADGAATDLRIPRPYARAPFLGMMIK